MRIFFLRQCLAIKYIGCFCGNVFYCTLNCCNFHQVLFFIVCCSLNSQSFTCAAEMQIIIIRCDCSIVRKKSEYEIKQGQGVVRSIRFFSFRNGKFCFRHAGQKVTVILIKTAYDLNEN